MSEPTLQYPVNDDGHPVVPLFGPPQFTPPRPEPTVHYPVDGDGNPVIPLFAPTDFTPPSPPPLSQLPLSLLPEPEPRRTWTARTTLLALAMAASVFLATAGVFGALYLAAGGDRAAAAASLAERRSELADLTSRLASAESDQQRDQQRNSGLASQNAALSVCVQAVQHRLWDNLSDAQQLVAVRAIIAECQ
jgi:hypothetical protein